MKTILSFLIGFLIAFIFIKTSSSSGKSTDCPYPMTLQIRSSLTLENLQSNSTSIFFSFFHIHIKESRREVNSYLYEFLHFLVILFLHFDVHDTEQIEHY